MDKFFSYFKLILIALILSYIVRTFIFNIALVNGNSMNPTLQNKEALFSISSFINKDFKQGDIVVFKSSIENSNYIKRIIAVPNQRITIKHGCVYVDEEILEEDYISNPYTENFQNIDLVLGEDEYFVMGDNRDPYQSVDSRHFGPIDRSRIISKSIFRIFPLSKIGKI